VGQPVQFNDGSVSFGSILQWRWFFGDGNTSSLQSPVHTYATPGPKEVKLVVLGNNGCWSDTARQTINVGTYPIANFNASDVCEGSAVNFQDASTVTVGTLNSWTWDFGDNNGSTAQNPSHTYATTGPKTITLLVKTQEGCASPPIVKTVNVRPIPDVSALFSDTCVNNAMQFRGINNKPSVPVQDWYWALGDGTTSTNQNFSHTFTAGGQYTVKLKINPVYGCPLDTIRQTITIGTVPVAAFDAADVCEGAPVVFTDRSAVQTGTINSWNWNFGNNNTSSLQNPAETYASTGTYPVVLNITTREGCRASVQKPVRVRPYAKADIDFADDCAGRPIQFSGTNLDPAVPIQSWEWILGDGFRSSNQNFAHVFTRAGNYTVRLVITPVDGCVPDTIRGTIRIYATRAFAGNDTIVSAGQPFQLRASGGGTIYSWSPPDNLSNPNIADPVAVLQRDAQYVVTVGTPQGCASTDTINIKVYKGPDIYVPTGFSPNGDGRNDVFQFLAIGVPDIQYFRVFNRWGQLLYDSPVRGRGWDGKLKGVEQPAGIYVWMVQGKDYNGRVITKKGTVMLVR
jgi:gliding motility-associated-like protein